MPTYVVQRGDTLSRITRKLGLRNYRELTGYRSGNPNLIYPGEVLTYGSSEDTEVRRESRRVDPAPAFLSFDPRHASLERHAKLLRQRIAEAEHLAYENGQAAAYLGSRRYQLDPGTERMRNVQRFVERLTGGPRGRARDGVIEMQQMREFEQKAARYERDAAQLRSQLRPIEQELGRR